MTTSKPSVVVRNATVSDATHACEIMRRSISELCVADHRNDPEILSDWLANKKPEIVKTWIARSDNTVLIALIADAPVAVGSVTHTGEIQLNYVLPDARFSGVSNMMLHALERVVRDRGLSTVRLFSTETAHCFYQKRGYVDDTAPEGRFGTDSSYPMSKRLDEPHTP